MWITQLIIQPVIVRIMSFMYNLMTDFEYFTRTKLPKRIFLIKQVLQHDLHYAFSTRTPLFLHSKVHHVQFHSNNQWPMNSPWQDKAIRTQRSARALIYSIWLSHKPINSTKFNCWIRLIYSIAESSQSILSAFVYLFQEQQQPGPREEHR